MVRANADTERITVEINGPGFNVGIVARFELPGSVTISQLVRLVAAKTRLNKARIVLVVGATRPESRVARVSPEFLSAEKVLLDGWLTLAECDLSEGSLDLVYTGDFARDYRPLGAGGNSPQQPLDVQDPPARESHEPNEAGAALESLEEEQMGEPRYFRVAVDFLAVRSSPSTRARKCGGLARGDVIFGTPYKIENDPWLCFGKEERPSWALIHGACLGLGQLLEAIAQPQIE